MKKFLLSVVIAINMIACNTNNEKPIETSSDKIEVKDTANEKLTEISFEDYKTEYKEATEKARIDFNSNPNYKVYKTVISETYHANQVSFAGNYTIATWGCGTSCIYGVMVDIRDGKIYNLPSDDEWEGIGNKLDHNKESTLLITILSGVNFGDGIDTMKKYWKWNETEKKFEFIKTLEFKGE